MELNVTYYTTDVSCTFAVPNTEVIKSALNIYVHDMN